LTKVTRQKAMSVGSSLTLARVCNSCHSNNMDYKSALACRNLMFVTGIMFFLAATGCSKQSSYPPILILTGHSGFGTYTGEILKAEGFNEFMIDSLTDNKLNLAYLNNFDVVILSETAVTKSQKEMLSTFVKGGGNLIAFRPDKQLEDIFGITGENGSTAEGYLKIDVSGGIGKGLVAETIQFHGISDTYRLNGAEKIAIPQADEQMRLLSHIFEKFTSYKKPVPRFWYFPDEYKCIFIFTIDGEDSRETDIDNEISDFQGKGGNKVYPNWAGDVGHLTGSGILMKFAEASRKILNVYQSNTQLPDETWLKENIESKSKTLIARSLDEENYAYINANYHTWFWPECREPGLKVLDYCNQRGVQIWPAEKVSEFLKMKDEALFNDISWSHNQLTFRIQSSIKNPNGLTFLLPAVYDGSEIKSIGVNGHPLKFQTRMIKGYEYAMVTVEPGNMDEISADYR
jgi:hypothetical protein